MQHEYRYKLTEEDYNAFFVFTGWEAPWLKTQRIKLYIKFFLSGILMSWFTITILHSLEGYKNLFNFPNIIGTLAGATIMVFFTGYSVESRLENTISELLKEDGGKSLLEERVLVLEDEYLIMTIEEGMSKLKWSGIKRYVATYDAFYLITGSLTGYIIPKRILSTQEEIDALDQFLKQKISVSDSKMRV